MPIPNRYEEQFLDALKDIFIGAKVEGDSGYINLMKIKARYFSEGVFPQLMKDIDKACKPFEKPFREELFDKLYDFFKRYFSESGSIYFRNTALHNNIYEKVYTDDRDVMLFWKTHMLYYVKTDRLFNSMEIEVAGETFRFDVSGMELKRSNEKRELTYAFQAYKGGKVILTVGYSEKGRKTKVDDILRALKEKGITLGEETLEQAFRVFEKQSEVDYFINKNAKAFLKEQFDLWLYQYVFSGESDFDEARLKQLQAIKGIAYKIIDFIAQFEDELVRVWNKPKFALNSHYIITLDKITDPKLLKKIFAHKGMKAQLQEWQDLGMVDSKFKLDKVLEKDLLKEPAHPQYQFLPLDTKHFPDLKLDILALFDDLDSSLDGWLIHSENYQALNTFSPKFRERINCVYIDPPYNTAASEIIYQNNYKHSSWLSLLNDRLETTVNFMRDDSIICVAIDDFELPFLQNNLSTIFGEEMHLATTAIRSNPHGRAMAAGFSQNHEYALYFGKTKTAIVGRLPRDERKQARYPEKDDDGDFAWMNFRATGANSRRSDRLKLFYPIFVTPKGDIRISAMQWSSETQKWEPLEPATSKETTVLPIDSDNTERVWNLGWERAKEEFKINLQAKLIDGRWQIYRKYRPNQEGALPNTWWDDAKYSATESGTRIIKDLLGERELFSYPKSVYLVEDSLRASNCYDNAYVLDFFAGSGTTAHAVMNLNREDSGKRKYILVEMGEHFNTVILPRIKKVAFSDKWKDGKAQEGKGISHFAKYFELEQYEDSLRHAKYEDGGLFATTDAYNSYVFLRDLKMLNAVALDKKKNKVNVQLDKLYEGIDLAETLSCVTGKWIKRITKETVEFQDGTTASLTDPDWSLVKPLVWW
jgi:adenine-specific DNA-methyltransferase